jgi:hypothetical protein
MRRQQEGIGMSDTSGPTIGGMTMIVPQNTPHLGGNIKEGDPRTFCPRVWDYVIQRFCIGSVMDLGSGAGNAADWFFKKGVRTIAVDGLSANIPLSFYPAVCHDLTKGPVVTSVDLVHCQEMVEHIEERYLGSLLSSLACGRVILMTHALPGQGGHHHVNEKAADYWINHIQARGYNLMVEDTNRVRGIAKQERAVFMERSGLIFHRK